jgi:hypothetical protein
MIKNVYLSSSTRYSCLTSTKLEFSQQTFKKKIMKRCQMGGESFQTDRHDAGNSSFSQFYECTEIPNEF